MLLLENWIPPLRNCNPKQQKEEINKKKSSFIYSCFVYDFLKWRHDCGDYYKITHIVVFVVGILINDILFYVNKKKKIDYESNTQ